MVSKNMFLQSFFRISYSTSYPKIGQIDDMVAHRFVRFDVEWPNRVHLSVMREENHESFWRVLAVYEHRSN